MKTKKIFLSIILLILMGVSFYSCENYDSTPDMTKTVITNTQNFVAEPGFCNAEEIAKINEIIKELKSSN